MFPVAGCQVLVAGYGWPVSDSWILISSFWVPGLKFSVFSYLSYHVLVVHYIFLKGYLGVGKVCLP